jgi:hypothetical protein
MFLRDWVFRGPQNGPEFASQEYMGAGFIRLPYVARKPVRLDDAAARQLIFNQLAGIALLNHDSQS